MPIKFIAPTVIFISGLFLTIKSTAQDPFVTLWKTNNPGYTDSLSIKVPAYGAYTYIWAEDGNPANNGSGSGNGTLNLTFSNAGVYRVSIRPLNGSNRFRKFSFGTASQYTSDARKLIDIEKWGDISWSTMQAAFFNATGLTAISATDTPDLSSVTDMSYMFYGAANLTDVPGMNDWNVSNVTNMKSVFGEAGNFNENISNWNVSKVTTMHSMFGNARSFNQDIGSWNVANVQYMTNMFGGATTFNRDIGNWVLDSLKSTFGMFNGAVAFNQDIGDWNVSHVTDMTAMFLNAASFNQDLSEWNVSRVATMNQMFQRATAFNGNIAAWNTSRVYNMNNMFDSAVAFNQDISNWLTSKVNYMNEMFLNAYAFNQDIGNWDVDSVRAMNGMFENASAFDRNLGKWQFMQIIGFTDMLKSSGLSCTNYDSTLIGWAANAALPTGLTLGDVSALIYTAKGDTARTALINNKGLILTGDTYNDLCSSVPLPIKWQYFKAVKAGNQALLQWATATEESNTGFEIQRSSNGADWARLGFVVSKAENGNSKSQLTYQYYDAMPLEAGNFYRLKQIGRDGKWEYSSVEKLDFGANTGSITLYPNPVRSAIYIKGFQGDTKIVVLNASGRMIAHLAVSGDAKETILSCGDWAKGIYFIKITDSTGQMTTRKIIKE